MDVSEDKRSQITLSLNGIESLFNLNFEYCYDTKSNRSIEMI